VLFGSGKSIICPVLSSIPLPPPPVPRPSLHFCLHRIA
jgi:hypothetical protein